MSRRQRVTTALLLAPLPILALLFLPTPWLAALVAAVMLAGLWEWTAFAGLRETLPRVGFLTANALMLAAHWPLLRFARQSLAGLSRPDRRLAFAGLGVIAAAYLVIFVMVFDYSRWVSSGLICLWLALHAIRTLPSAKPAALPEMTGATLSFAILVTLLGRVGTVTPF